jgi:uncharacterized GH25 family protein
MSRSLAALFALVVAPLAASAHMVYVVPSADGTAVTVVFSDTLEPDPKVKMEKVAGLALTAVTADGKPAAVALKKEDHRFTAALPAGAKIAFGDVTYGVLTKTATPALLVYHPKAVLAGADAKAAIVGDAAELELVPVTEGGKTRFRLLAKGKPVAGSEGTVVLPGGTKEKAKTDADGYTPAYAGAGRYAAYFKVSEARAGEHAGQKYEEVRHYATLVADVAK